jgi:hypothetical protein
MGVQSPYSLDHHTSSQLDGDFDDDLSSTSSTRGYKRPDMGSLRRASIAKPHDVNQETKEQSRAQRRNSVWQDIIKLDDKGGAVIEDIITSAMKEDELDGVERTQDDDIFAMHSPHTITSVLEDSDDDDEEMYSPPLQLADSASVESTLPVSSHRPSAAANAASFESAGTNFGGLGNLLGGNLVGIENPDNFVLSKKSSQKWQWFVLALVHLRFADSAEQHEDNSILSDLGCDNASLNSADISRKSDYVVRPTRRATLFGSVMGTYQEESLEGLVTSRHCLGDDISSITQRLRVSKSRAMHRLQIEPLLYFDDVRPSHPRALPVLRQKELASGSLLHALQAAKELREKKKAELTSKRKTANAPLSRSNSRRSSILSQRPPPHRPSRRASLANHGANLRSRRQSMAPHRRSSVLSPLGEHALVMSIALSELSTKKRVLDTVEFHLPRPFDIFALLRQLYDPEGLSALDNDFYTPANLLRRESLRFNEDVQHLLGIIWIATDSDDSGLIDSIEYIELHSALMCALLGRKAGDSMHRMYLCRQDWNSDRKGFKSLNKRRLEDSFFTLAGTALIIPNLSILITI